MYFDTKEKTVTRKSAEASKATAKKQKPDTPHHPMVADIRAFYELHKVDPEKKLHEWIDFRLVPRAS